MELLTNQRSREEMTPQENVYKVEKVVDKRLRNGVEEYRIKWLNYSSSENTWENEENCFGCYRSIIKFESTHFNCMQKFHPEIIGIKVHWGRIKLLVEWRCITEKQYYYSKAIRLVDPAILLEFYDKYLSKKYGDEKPQRVDHCLTEREDVSDDDWVILDLEKGCTKQNYYSKTIHRVDPTILIKFYEKYISRQDFEEKLERFHPSLTEHEDVSDDDWVIVDLEKLRI